MRNGKGQFIRGGKVVHSETTKRKIGDAQRGEKNHNWGKVLADVTKKKISDSKKGKKSYEMTDKIRKNISDSKKGDKHPNWKGGVTKENKKKYIVKWREKNYDRVLYLNLRRRVKKLELDGEHTFGEWENLKKQYNFICPCCNKKEPEIKLTQDHIIPLSKGGSDNIENIQPLCRSCNSKKNNKIIDKF